MFCSNLNGSADKSLKTVNFHLCQMLFKIPFNYFKATFNLTSASKSNYFWQGHLEYPCCIVDALHRQTRILGILSSLGMNIGFNIEHT